MVSHQGDNSRDTSSTSSIRLKIRSSSMRARLQGRLIPHTWSLNINQSFFLKKGEVCRMKSWLLLCDTLETAKVNKHTPNNARNICIKMSFINKTKHLWYQYHPLYKAVLLLLYQLFLVFLSHLCSSTHSQTMSMFDQMYYISF